MQGARRNNGSLADRLAQARNTPGVSLRVSRKMTSQTAVAAGALSLAAVTAAVATIHYVSQESDWSSGNPGGHARTRPTSPGSPDNDQSSTSVRPSLSISRPTGSELTTDSSPAGADAAARTHEPVRGSVAPRAEPASPRQLARAAPELRKGSRATGAPQISSADLPSQQRNPRSASQAADSSLAPTSDPMRSRPQAPDPGNVERPAPIDSLAQSADPSLASPRIIEQANVSLRSPAPADLAAETVQMPVGAKSAFQSDLPEFRPLSFEAPDQSSGAQSEVLELSTIANASALDLAALDLADLDLANLDLNRAASPGLDQPSSTANLDEQLNGSLVYDPAAQPHLYAVPDAFLAAVQASASPALAGPHAEQQRELEPPRIQAELISPPASLAEASLEPGDNLAQASFEDVAASPLGADRLAGAAGVRPVVPPAAELPVESSIPHAATTAQRQNGSASFVSPEATARVAAKSASTPGIGSPLPPSPPEAALATDRPPTGTLRDDDWVFFSTEGIGDRSEAGTPGALQMATVAVGKGRQESRLRYGQSVSRQGEHGALELEGSEALDVIPLMQDSAGTVSVRLEDLITLLENRMERPLFVWLKSSESATKYVTFDTLRSAGIEVDYDASTNHLILSVPELAGR